MKIVKVIGASIGVIVCFFYLGCGSVQVAEAARSNASSLAITTTALPSAIVGTPYVAVLDASGGTPGYIWRVTSGALPAGLTIASTTGVISGTPTVPGNFSFSVSLSDAGHPTQSKSTAMTISVAALPLAITPAVLPAASIGVAYAQTLTATGGVPAYKWSVTSGNLPLGLTLSSTGVISGAPTASGTSNFTATVQDSQSQPHKASLGFTIVVAASKLQIAPSALAAGVAGASYSQGLMATGGTPAYKWMISSGNLPLGLTLTSAGTISGTPTSSGTSTFIASVSDNSVPTQAASATFSITVAPPALAILPATLPSVVVGSSYSQSLNATGGTQPYKWSVTSGTLPAGLTLGSAGTISGVPTQSGTSSFTATVTDSSNRTQSASAIVSVVVTATQLRAVPVSLPAVKLGASYSQSLQATGGTAPYKWTVSAGNLPAGLTLSSTGAITGAPTASGIANFTATVTDSSNPVQTASTPASILVSPTLLTITSSSLPSVTTGSAYAQTLQASGGSAPYRWSISAGKLPAGLILSPTTGTITGVATTLGTATFTATVTDNSSPAQVASATTAVVVSPSATGPANPVSPLGSALAIATSALPSLSLGAAYSQTLQATGGTAPYSWSLASGQLPLGLSLSATGVLSGTPTTSNGSTFTVSVSDSSSPVQTQSVGLTIGAGSSPLAITSSALIAGTTGTGYSQALAASGGTPAYTWSITSGSLPAGLTLAATTGVISGTPSVTGTSTFTATVQDNGSPAQSQSVATSITVAAPAAAGTGHTWYVDAAIGGSRYSTNVPTGLCDGTADAAPVGTTPNQHCAFKDARMLYQDGSYVSLPGASFPAWGWVGQGGDTYIINGSVGQGISYPIGWNSLSNYCDSTGCWGVVGQPQSSGMLTPPSGTATSHTKIYGGCMLTNTCDARNTATLTELFGSWGPDNVMSLYGTNYVDVAGFSITDHSNCGFATDYIMCKVNGITQSSFAKNGIQLFNTTTNTTLNHVRIHGLGSFGMYGAVGDGFTATDLVLIGNASGGWNADDSSGNTGTGHTLIQNFDISWNGCVEEYPIVDAVPYFSCTDQSYGGYGDGFGTASMDSPAPGWQVHFDNGTVSYNTQDGLDALHIGGTGSTTAYTRVLAYANEGNQLKIGGATATVQDSAINGNCEALTSGTPIPGRPAVTHDMLGSACRAGNTAVVMETTPGFQAYYQNNTCYSAGAICLEVEYATADQGPGNTLQYNNNIFVGFFNTGAGSYPTPVYGMNGLAMLTSNPGASFTNNAYFHPRANWSCPGNGESNALCGDPGLVDETYHIYGVGNMAPASPTSPVVGAGIAIPTITLDYTGYTRPSSPSIGAYEYPH